MAEILEVDLLRFERGDAAARAAVVDGVRRSLATGFVYTSHDLPEDVIDEAYAKLAKFFSMDHDTKQRFVAPGSHGQTGYTGLLVETAASPTCPTGRRCSTGATSRRAGHPLRRKYPHRYMDQVLPEAAVPGITEVLMLFHQRIYDLQRRFLRIIALGLGAHEDLFESMLPNGSTLTRAIRYPPMPEAPAGQGARVGRRARRHQPHHRAAPRHRAGPAGEDRRGLGRRGGPRGQGDHQHRDDARGALQRRDPARRPPGGRRPGLHRRALQRGAVLPSHAVDDPLAPPVVLHAGARRSASAPSRRATSSTRCSTRSTWSKTPAASATERRARGAPVGSSPVAAHRGRRPR